MRTSPQKRSGVALVDKGLHSFTCTLTCLSMRPGTERTTPVFAFSAEAGFHLPTPEEWKAELA